MSAKISIRHLQQMKAEGEPIAALTAYDASFARLLEQAGVEVILVGDSLGMVVQGHETTLPVKLKEMIYHTRAVKRGCQRPWIVVDLPFMSCARTKSCLRAAHKLMQAGADMVKLEGGEKKQIQRVKSLVAQSVPVCAHLGLLPQSIKRLGGYRQQGQEASSAAKIEQQALELQAAGAQMLILECVPAALAARIRQQLSIPVIGIGAGADCDGQVLVLYDVLGIADPMPSFSRSFMQTDIPSALKQYVQAVKSKQFPPV